MEPAGNHQPAAVEYQTMMLRIPHRRSHGIGNSGSGWSEIQTVNFNLQNNLESNVKEVCA